MPLSHPKGCSLCAHAELIVTYFESMSQQATHKKEWLCGEGEED